MTLPKKGARRIVVDGTAYRWRVRRRPTYMQGIALTRLNFAVEHAAHPGTTLVVDTGHAHPRNWMDIPPVSVRPADVAASIRLGLARGWQPSSPGSPFMLARSSSATSP
ncbi:hypothetical protein [Nocardia sp. NBC_01009]|uniref:hypothetical protein n=1 Tax=Nocardia sp. NBC_01009 TaxID=2975996 RepID=UPI00386ACAE0|nr:hypothetical protein OHA42_26810 [Nocardia sp. NBC_01009]